MPRADLTLPPRKRLAVVAMVLLFHLLLLLGLIRGFAPDFFTDKVIDNLSAVLIVTIPPPEPPPPSPTMPEEQGAAAPAGKLAEPQQVAAPEPKIVIVERQPAPRIASAGDDLAAGARDRGEDTGAGGVGQGTGAGGSGAGQGGGAARQLEKIAGDINSSRDYPRATRALREGRSVTIQLTVGTDGRASNCRIVTPSPDPEADRITCRLAVERFRFRPRTDAQGIPVPGEYRWRQRWWDPRR